MIPQKFTSRSILVIFLAAVSAFVFFFRLGSGSLTSWDEAIYAGVAREIVQSGQWLRPTFLSISWLEKPPLCIWAVATLYHFFGISEFTARFFSALCGFGTVLVTYLIGSKLFNRWIGFLSGMFLVTSRHFPRYARLGVMDAPLVFFVSLAFLFFWLARKKNIYFSLFGIALGLAFLTKGIAAFFVLPVTWIYCWWANELFIFKKPSYWLGILMCAMIAIPWNVYQIMAHPDTYSYALYTQIFLRTTEIYEGHSGDLSYYFGVVFNKYRPWIVLLVFSLPFFIFKTIRTKNKEMILITSWIFLVFGSVAFVKTKLHWYILPLYPALSICVAYGFAQVIKEKYVLFVSTMFLITIAFHAHQRFFKSDYNPDLKSISAAVKQIVPKGKQVSFYNSDERHASFFYTERGTTSIHTQEAFVTEAKKPDFYCLIYEDDFKNLNAVATDLRLIIRASAGKLLFLSREGP